MWNQPYINYRRGAFLEITCMIELINRNMARYLRFRYKNIQYFMDRPFESQDRIFKDLIRLAKNTEWGTKYNFASIENWEQFNERVPVSTYDELKPSIIRMMYGQQDVLWPGEVKWFSKSSGTTNDKSKFIPVSSENLKKSHFKSTWDVLTFLYMNKPESNLFSGKNLGMGGSIAPFEGFPGTIIGDISGILLKNSPPIGKSVQVPDTETSLIADWNVKIEKIARLTQKENLISISGVPTWAVVLFRRIMELTGKENMLEVWPNAEVYIHGGVSFEPYKEQFKRLFPSDDFTYLEVYNSSEGYFGIQDDLTKNDMLLLLNNEIFYEFIPFDDFETDRQKVIELKDVELKKNYVLVVSTNAGLWRYIVGDTIRFTNLSPFKIKITGRVKHFINVFGEEVMVSNTDKAVATTCSKFGVTIDNYTVAPVFLTRGKKGGHQWLVEFNKLPNDLDAFKKDLDLNLQNINSDYEAKRFNDLALKELELVPLPKGSFYKWMESRGKLGGQNKVPRLSNSREYVESILSFINHI